MNGPVYIEAQELDERGDDIQQTGTERNELEAGNPGCQS